MENPFFRNYSWNNARPRYSAKNRGIPVHQVKSEPPKVVSIPVHFVGSERTRSAAAVKIQKVFRGFVVKKSVKLIARIKMEADQLEQKIMKPEMADLIWKDAKERLKVNESLMALLLRLDSVRGVNSGVRDCRKSVIRKVISLQEAVDSIAVQGRAQNEFFGLNKKEFPHKCSEMAKDDDLRENVVAEASELKYSIESAGNCEIVADNEGLHGDVMEEMVAKQELTESAGSCENVVKIEKEGLITGKPLEKQDPVKSEGNCENVAEIQGLIMEETLGKLDLVEYDGNGEIVTQKEALDRSIIEETLEKQDHVENETIADKDGFHEETLEMQDPCSCDSVEETLAKRNYPSEAVSPTETVENFQSSVEEEGYSGANDPSKTLEKQAAVIIQRSSEASINPVTNQQRDCPEKSVVVDAVNAMEIEDRGDSNRVIIERMVEQNEKLKQLVTELCERNSLQNRLMNTLSQRVEQLERLVRSERLRKKKKKRLAATVDRAETPVGRKCGRKS